MKKNDNTALKYRVEQIFVYVCICIYLWMYIFPLLSWYVVLFSGFLDRFIVNDKWFMILFCPVKDFVTFVCDNCCINKRCLFICLLDICLPVFASCVTNTGSSGKVQSGSKRGNT